MRSLSSHLPLVVFALLLASGAQAQDTVSAIDTASLIVFQNPDPRPEFFSISYENAYNIGVSTSSNSPDFGQSSGTIQSNRRINAKLRIPLLLRTKRSIALGLGYAHEQFIFNEVVADSTIQPLYDRLQDRSLRIAGMRLYHKEALPRNRFLVSSLGVSFNGDRLQLNIADYAKANLALIYGKAPNLLTEYGVGLVFSYDLGIPAAYPLFLYRRWLNRHFKLSLALPREAKLRYIVSPKMYVYSRIGLEGASYHLRDQVLPGFDRLELRRSALRGEFIVDREVYDWLWFRGRVGWLYPINLFLSKPDLINNEPVVSVSAQSIPAFNLTLFLVPPRRLYQIRG